MNAAETIAAAIDKLERQRSRASDGMWKPDPVTRTNGTVAVSNDVGRFVTHYTAEHDADLIVTLHRTIDAQLFILKSALVRTVPRFGEYVFAHEAVELARAILGEVSS